MSKAKETGNAERCTKDSAKKNHKRKRKYHGNQYTKKKKVSEFPDTTGIAGTSSTSSKKKRGSVVTEDDRRKTTSYKKLKNVADSVSNNLEGFRLVDMSILKDLLSLLCCPGPECKETSLIVEEDERKKKGLSSFLTVNCTTCPFSWSSHTSKGAKTNQRVMEVNLRAVYAMRRCGIGHSGLQRFCGGMNMPPPVTSKNYAKLSDRLGDAVEKVAKSSMIEAAAEVKQKEGKDVGISFDGTWQKRGHSSLNGVAAAISITNGKVLDVEVLSRHCKGCVDHAALKITKPDEYDSWKITHNEKCHLNHDGSASSMEKVAAVNIFSRSMKNYDLRYLKYFGDGDSSSFSAVENIYVDATCKKSECLGHYQKRVGNRLRKLRQRVKGLGGTSKAKEIMHCSKDGKVIKMKEKARGMLTNSAIDMLQNYFGIALRSGAKTVPELRNKLWASFFHLASSEKHNYHTYCPATSDSWCQDQRDNICKTNLYKPDKGYEPHVIKHVIPEYKKLTTESELSKCFHGNTQNANESFNSLIWGRAPKTRYCGLPKLKLSVYDAVSYFNYGSQSIIGTYKLLVIDAGSHTNKFAVNVNILRTYTAGYKGKNTSMIRRQMIRGLKKEEKRHNVKTGRNYI